ncbi:hypothetical protein ACFWBF_10775 [Streptomyces sp. NPDC060028]|uniref:hypothetical protein n=1 Tax=Streptomyces sp. NPDC060028 TaxID=3347041 RepID=UPI0036A5670A
MRRPTASIPRSAARRAAVVLTALLAGLVVMAPPAGAESLAPHPLNVNASSANGVVTSGPGCSSGPLTDTRRLTGSSALSAGVFSALPSQLGIDLPFRVGGTQAVLESTDARVTLTNARGTLTLALQSGSCAAPGLSYSGTSVTGSGTWTVVPDATTTNAYRGATGSGTFAIPAAAVSVGTGKAWQLALSGSITVLQPQLAVTHRAYWGGPLNYLSRTLGVEYRIRNTGPGDAFGVVLTDALPAGSGVTRIGPVPQAVGALAAGAEKQVVVRYRVCGLLVLNCRFTADVQVLRTDALDDGGTESFPRTVQVPLLPVP